MARSAEYNKFETETARRAGMTVTRAGARGEVGQMCGESLRVLRIAE